MKAPQPKRRWLVGPQPLAASPRMHHNRHAPAEGLPDPGVQRPHIGAIGPDPFQARQRRLELLEQPGRTGTILDIGGMDHRAKHQAQGIHEQMAFAAREFLGSIVPMRTATFGRLDRLTIQNGGARRRLPSALLTHPLAQRRMELLPRPARTPPTEIGIDCGPEAATTHWAVQIQSHYARTAAIHRPLGVVAV